MRDGKREQKRLQQRADHGVHPVSPRAPGRESPALSFLHTQWEFHLMRSWGKKSYWKMFSFQYQVKLTFCCLVLFPVYFHSYSNTHKYFLSKKSSLLVLVEWFIKDVGQRTLLFQGKWALGNESGTDHDHWGASASREAQGGWAGSSWLHSAPWQSWSTSRLRAVSRRERQRLEAVLITRLLISRVLKKPLTILSDLMNTHSARCWGYWGLCTLVSTFPFAKKEGHSQSFQWLKKYACPSPATSLCLQK